MLLRRRKTRPSGGDAAAALERATAAAEEKGAEGADALALVTEWHDYRRPNFARLRSIMRTPVVVDGRNVWEPSEVRTAGFTYYGVGRGRGSEG